MTDITIKKGEIIDLYTLPEFSAGDALAVVNKSIHDVYVSSGAQPSMLEGAPVRKYGVGSLEAGSTAGWVSSPYGNVVLSVNP